MQPISKFFRPLPAKVSRAAGKRQASPQDAADGDGSAAGTRQAAGAAATAAAPPPAARADGGTQQQFARKRRRPSGGDSAAAGTQPPASATAAGSRPPAQQQQHQQGQQQQGPRQLTQMFLDVGQRHFHSFKCPGCGMVYTRGTEADDRLHAAFHASATEGPRYSGWQGEKVAQVDGSRGRVLLFGSADLQGRGRKQLQELCAFLEEQMGLLQGWLLRVPLTVLLYVSSGKRIQAVVAAETIKEALPVKPCLPANVLAGMRSAESAAAAPASSGQAAGGEGGRAAGAVAEAAAAAASDGRSRLSVTLSSRPGGSAAAAAAAAAAATGECGQSSGGGPPAAEEAAAGEPQPAGAGEGVRQARQDKQQQPEQQQQGQPPAPAAQQPPPPSAAAPASLPEAPPPPLALDRSRRVRAVCGVRLMWVSTEARRRGLATRLLDCCRCQVMPGYVVPRHKLAFSAPTDDGRAFIESYAGTRRFLVYE